MQCPKDSSLLKAQVKGNLQIDFCEACGGFFVNLGQEAALQLEKLLKKDLERGSTAGSGMVLPSSGVGMRGFDFRGVHLDYCEGSHAIWFDRGEYQKIFSQPGRVKSRLQGEKRDAVVDTADVAYGAEGAIDFLGNVGGFLGDLLSGVDLF